jgi:hypothetical protein
MTTLAFPLRARLARTSSPEATVGRVKGIDLQE